MKESELNSKISQALEAFDAMEVIEPSAEWNESVLNKLTAAKHSPTAKSPSAKAAVVMLFLILLNVGFIWNMVNKERQPDQRKGELQAISMEFLINPVSLDLLQK